MHELRITAGSLRGRRIPVPPGGVRPTSERARQAYFNIVAPRIAGARFVDLFTGTGIFSFEAVSRGAVSATAVDASKQHTASIERLARQWNAPVRAVAGDSIAFLRHAPEFDLAYADPPYDFGQYDQLLAAFERHAPDDALIAIEHRRRHDPFAEAAGRLRRIRRAEYGEVWISFFSAREGKDEA